MIDTLSIAQARDIQVSICSSLQLISANDAEAFINECMRLNVFILGIDGFKLKEGKVLALVDCIADFSEIIELASDRLETSNKLANEFVSKFNDVDLFFDFTLSR